jgi:hypothetical protein
MQRLSQIVPILKSHNVMGIVGIVDGTNPCPPSFLPDADGKRCPQSKILCLGQEGPIPSAWIKIVLFESLLFTVYEFCIASDKFGQSWPLVL